MPESKLVWCTDFDAFRPTHRVQYGCMGSVRVTARRDVQWRAASDERLTAMSKFAKDGNSFRREWDKEAFEKKAKERLEAELALEEDREHAKTAPQPIVQRAPLQRRTEDLQLAKFVGSRQVVTGAQALAGQMAGAYYCNVCECPLRDSANYLLHINGRKHNRMLGMSMRAERSTVAEVRARLEAHKGDKEEEARATPHIPFACPRRRNT